MKQLQKIKQNEFKNSLFAILLLMFTFSFMGCKSAQVKEFIVVNKKITTIDILNFDEVIQKPQEKIMLSFMNDEQTYFLEKNDEFFMTFREFLLNDYEKSKFYLVELVNNKIINVQSLNEEQQTELNKNREIVCKNKKMFRYDIQANYSSWQSKEKHYLEEEIEQGMNLDKLGVLFKENDSLMKYPISYAQFRTSILSLHNLNKHGLKTYKLLLVPKQKNRIIKFSGFGTSGNLSLNWIIINIYKHVDENKLMTWYVIDPYLFNKPITVNEVINKIEKTSNIKLDSYILSPKAYGFDTLENTALYGL